MTNGQFLLLADCGVVVNLFNALRSFYEGGGSIVWGVISLVCAVWCARLWLKVKRELENDE